MLNFSAIRKKSPYNKVFLLCKFEGRLVLHYVIFLLSPFKIGGIFLLLGSLFNVKKSYGDRMILDIDELKIFQGDRIGLVGENGSGKSTLIKILIGEEERDSGEVTICNSYSYISQGVDFVEECDFDYEWNSTSIKAPNLFDKYLSGGEKVKFKIVNSLKKKSKLIIGDEITSNLDRSTIDSLEKLLLQYDGGLLLVSHDREFLDNVCNIIIELKDGKVKKYNGNYSKYLEVKELENLSEEREYIKYINEKEHLERAIIRKEEIKNSIKRTPKRMGNSEARLHKMGGQKGKKKLDGNVKALKSRIEHLEIKEKPKKVKNIKIKVQDGLEIYSKIVAEGKNICIKRGNKTLIKDSNFVINKGDKVALIGDNGSGKTSLIKEIINNVDNIKVNKRVKIGYFDQEQKILNDNLTILENIKYNSRFEESFIRICLSVFGFKRDDVHKNVGILSGGEKVKVSLCKVLLDDNNLLILDEPTNYLDINSITALEEALSGTDKAFIIISHDRKLISYICNKIFEIKNCKLITFRGNYYDYSQDHKKVRDNKEDEKMLLRTKLSEVLSRLSIEKNDIIKEKLEKEYNKILEKLNNI